MLIRRRLFLAQLVAQLMAQRVAQQVAPIVRSAGGEDCQRPRKAVPVGRAGMIIRSGFSLPELLVVIVIIAMLAGMLFSAITVVRSSALSTSCQSRYRQIALIFDIYLSENEDVYPPSHVAWKPYNIFVNYLLGTNVQPANENAKLFMCTEDKNRPTDIVPTGLWGAGSTVWAKDGQSHGYNTWGLGGSGGGWGTHIMANQAQRGEIKYPQATILSADTRQWSKSGYVSGYLGNDYGYAQAAFQSVYPTHRGKTQCNVLWVDYHVSSVSAAGPEDQLSLRDPLRLGTVPPSSLGSCFDRD